MGETVHRGHVAGPINALEHCGLLTMMSALSTAVQQLVEHVIKKRWTWLDTTTPGQEANEGRRATAIHASAFLVGALLAYLIGLQPLKYFGLAGSGPFWDAVIAGVLVSFGSSFFDEALGAVRAFKKAQESIKQ